MHHKDLPFTSPSFPFQHVSCAFRFQQPRAQDRASPWKHHVTLRERQSLEAAMGLPEPWAVLGHEAWQGCEHFHGACTCPQRGCARTLDGVTSCLLRSVAFRLSGGLSRGFKERYLLSTLQGCSEMAARGVGRESRLRLTNLRSWHFVGPGVPRHLTHVGQRTGTGGSKHLIAQ